MADRIQARAIRRCGGLLKAIKSARGVPVYLPTSSADPTKLSRTLIAALALVFALEAAVGARNFVPALMAPWNEVP